MQIKRINTYIPKVNVQQPQFKGVWFNEYERALLDSSFRDDELYNPRKDYQDEVYRIYDYNDVPLSLPKKPLDVPILFMQTYDLKDARRFEVDSSRYFNEESSLEVLDENEHKSTSDGFSISDTLLLRRLASVRTKEGKMVHNSKLNRALKEFVIVHPSSKQYLANEAKKVCVVKDYDNEEYFVESIFKIIMRNCENVPQYEVTSVLEDVKDFVSVANLEDSKGRKTWNLRMLKSLEIMDYYLPKVALSEKKDLAQAFIVKDKSGNSIFVDSAFDCAIDSNVRFRNLDLLADVVKNNIYYDADNDNYAFNSKNAMKSLR